MARIRKTTNKNNIIILCEGSDTEVKYFKGIKKYLNANFPDRFSEIRIVPIIEEKINTDNNRRPRRQLQPPHGISSSKRYWEKWEHSDEEYNKYKAQPTRYVREAQLFMEEDGFIEAWAVYDKDTFTSHKDAVELAASVNVNIAYSSYCFEEWLLLHFERNPNPFEHSVCKNNGKDKGCGTNVMDDCHGNICLAGYIREHNYIPNYAKSQDDIFTTYTLPNLNKALLNAAWSRSLSNDPFYLCNPYTNIDNLIKHLIDIDKEYIWCYLGDSVPFAGTTIHVTSQSGILTIINGGKHSIVFTPQNCIIYDEELSTQRPFITRPIIDNFIEDKTQCNDKYLCLIDSNKYYFFDLQAN